MRKKKMPKSPIWLDDVEMEILRGYLGELLADNQLPDYNREVISNAYKQTLDEDEEVYLAS
jgi:hypothetical protein